MQYAQENIVDSACSPAWLLFACITVLVPSFTSPLGAQTCASGEVRVIVIDSQESVIADAEVRVTSDTSVLGSLSTQIAGRAEMGNVPCGVWKVVVTKDGFEPSTHRRCHRDTSARGTKRVGEP